MTVLDIEGSGTFASVPALFAQLPQPPARGGGARADTPPGAVVLRLRGHLRTNLTFVTALENYANGVAGAGGVLVVCGLQPGTIAQLRSAGLPDSVLLVAQGDELDGSLAEAHHARHQLAGHEIHARTATDRSPCRAQLMATARACPDRRDLVAVNEGVAPSSGAPGAEQVQPIVDRHDALAAEQALLRVLLESREADHVDH